MLRKEESERPSISELMNDEDTLTLMSRLNQFEDSSTETKEEEVKEN